MFDDGFSDGPKAVVVSGHALLLPEPARLAQRNLAREQQVVPGDRAVVILVHGRSVP